MTSNSQSTDTTVEQINPLQQLDTSRGSSDSLLSTHSLSSTNSQNEPQLSFMVIVAFTANYVMGTGFLTIPWAFHKCGTLLGILVLFFMIGPSIMSVSFVLETIARATILLENSDDNVTTIELSSMHQEGTSATETTEIENNNPTVVLEVNESNHDSYDLSNKPTLPLVGQKKYETTELCEIFLGKIGKQCYALSIAVFLYGTLWAYGTVFASAIVTHINLGPYSYHIFLFLFSLIVVPLSCMELSEQLYLQIALSFCRIIMVFCMIGTVLYAAITKEDLFRLGDDIPPSPYHHWELFHWNGLHFMLPIAVYSNMFHHSIPALSEPAKDKRKLSYMFATALLCCFFSYTLIGCIVSVYFGDTILSSSNLNWEHFGQVHGNTFLGMFEKCIASYVIIFPALDVSSAFPLNAITLGNNLYTTFHSVDLPISTSPSSSSSNSLPSLTSHRSRNHHNALPLPTIDELESSNQETTSNDKTRNLVVFYRLLASIPPLIFAAFISDLGAITDYTGITGMVVVFIFPGLLSITSEKLLNRKELPTKTYYSTIFTTRKGAIFLIIFGTIMICFTLTSLILTE